MYFIKLRRSIFGFAWTASLPQLDNDALRSRRVAHGAGGKEPDWGSVRCQRQRHAFMNSKRNFGSTWMPSSSSW